MSLPDDILEIAKAQQACYAAGLRAADENGASARKLRRLCMVIEKTMAEEIPGWIWSRLRDTLAEARKP